MKNFKISQTFSILPKESPSPRRTSKNSLRSEQEESRKKQGKKKKTDFVIRLLRIGRDKRKNDNLPPFEHRLLYYLSPTRVTN